MKMSKKNSNVLAIAIMFFLFAMISFVTGLQNPMGVIVKSQFGATNAMSQLGNLANFIAYAFMGLPAGFILKKYGYKITALAAVAVGFIGVGISFLSGIAESFAVYLTGAFVSGFSMCMLNTVVNPMLNTLGGGGNKGNQLIQFGGSLNSLAATICPVLVGYLIGEVTSETAISDANPALFIAMGVFALAFVIILFSKIPEPELEAAKSSRQPQESTMESVSKALSHKNLVFGVIAIFLYVGIEVGIPNIANLYMTSPEVGISAGVAGTVVGMYWLLMLCGRLLGGVIGGKVSSKVMMTVVSTVAIVFILIGMFLPETFVKFPAISSDLSFSMVDIPLGVVFFVLCGLCTSVMWGAIFNLAVEGLGKYTSIASGLFMVMVCGGGVLPVIQGAIADKAGFIDSYWVLVIALAYLLVFAVSLSKPSVKSEK
ncbi:MAG: MFS transporter [Bacteroidetes bacterium]|uniref:MFS transporter n=1 Tax=Candidatus Cryptobacteroides faecipullorum TaxID=2840764 RepID=A0A9D9I713_9BACT|nr:MFS transporter [Candidatus Cryptobacteroides faecipullorum]